MCWHKWILWPGLCDDWGGMVEARVCLRCWRHEQQNHHGKWYFYGYLDPVKDRAWTDHIKEVHHEFFEKRTNRVCEYKCNMPNYRRSYAHKERTNFFSWLESRMRNLWLSWRG